MNRKNRKKCIRQAAANAQRIHRNGVDLLVVQSPGFRHLMPFSLHHTGTLFIPRGENVPKRVAQAVSLIRSGRLSRYDGPGKAEMFSALSRLQEGGAAV